MSLADFHIHSNCSPDAEFTMSEMARASRERGVGVLCFTDHVDLDGTMTGEYDPAHLERWDDMRAQYADAVRDVENLDIRLGVELGAISHQPEKALLVSSREELDFVIGSIHNAPGMPDYYFLQYESEEHCERLINDYLLDNLKLARTGGFDVIGHLGYIRRFTIRSGFRASITEDAHGDAVDAIFRRLIETGRGIEVNCVGFRAGIGPITPLWALRRYRELGGEVITIGSDAHTLDSAGTFLEDGFGLLAEAGFKYYTQFRQRKPEFVKLPEF